MSSPFISICIPAYKSIEHLRRLFDSISIQNYNDAEIIVTDDSPDNSVEEFIKAYECRLPVRYFRNDVALGTPENWNEGIRQARGEWIKLMHDDDWFTFPESLGNFAKAAHENPETSFIFSAYQNVNADNGGYEPVYLNPANEILLRTSSLNLFKKNYVGNPSCTLIRKDLNLFYDNQFKWVVDFEYYIRVLNKVKSYTYLNETLISVGISNEQVTKNCFRVPEVEIPENQNMLRKFGYEILRNPIVYDYYWRLYRNLGIRKVEDLLPFDSEAVHKIIHEMIKEQANISPERLKNGLISKSLMTAGYLQSLFIRLD